MHAFVDNLEVRTGRQKIGRKQPRPQDDRDNHGSEAAVATVWLLFYVLAIGIAVASPFVSRAIEFASR